MYVIRLLYDKKRSFLRFNPSIREEKEREERRKIIDTSYDTFPLPIIFRSRTKKTKG